MTRTDVRSAVLALLVGCAVASACGDDAASNPDGGPPPADGGGDGAVVACGNGALDPGEECDDGGDEPGDGCDGSCRFEAACIVAIDDGAGSATVSSFIVTRQAEAMLADALDGHHGTIAGTPIVTEHRLHNAIATCGRRVYSVQGRIDTSEQYLRGFGVSPTGMLSLPFLVPLAFLDGEDARAVACVNDTVVVAATASPASARPEVVLLTYQIAADVIVQRTSRAIMLGDNEDLDAASGTDISLHLVSNEAAGEVWLTGYYEYTGEGIVGQMARFRVESDGELTRLEPAGDAAAPIVGGFDRAGGMAIDPAGDWLVVTSYDDPQCMNGTAVWGLEGVLPSDAPARACEGTEAGTKWPVFARATLRRFFASTATTLRAFDIDASTGGAATAWESTEGAGGTDPFLAVLFGDAVVVSVAHGGGAVMLFDGENGERSDPELAVSEGRLLGIAAVPCAAP